MSDRELILARVRAALADVPGDEPAAWDAAADDDPAVAYLRDRSPAGPALTELFARRCAEYRATVTGCADAPRAIAGTVAEIAQRHAVTALAVAPGLDPEWVPRGPSVRIDQPPLSVAELDRCDAVLTGCALAIALTGTIVLDAGPGQGRRALSLIPDLHVCVVRAQQIVPGLPAAIDALRAGVGARRPLTFISGPSATSDIELVRVEGVHGPRRLEVVLAAGEA